MSKVKSLLKEWVDSFILEISEGCLEFDKECAYLSQVMAEAEDQIQKKFDEDLDPGKGEEPYLMKIFLSRLDFLKVKRTRAAEVLASLGLNNPGEAVMMAVLMKRLEVLNGNLTAKKVNLLLQGGTIQGSLFEKYWEKQKGLALDLPCDNMLDIIGRADLEN